MYIIILNIKGRFKKCIFSITIEDKLTQLITFVGTLKEIQSDPCRSSTIKTPHNYGKFMG